MFLEFGGIQNLEFKFESALPKDDEWELTKNQSELSMGLITLNEVRKRQGKKAFKSKLADIPWVNGSPLHGEDEEADKLIEKMSLGGAAMAGGGMAGGGMEAQGQVPGQAPMASLPQAQGAMGALGGRPQGSQMSSLMAEAFRVSKPSLSTLLSAARGNRGGLSSLIQTHPEMHSFSGMLSVDHVDTKLSKLFTKGIYDYIEKNFIEDEVDRKMFMPYEELIVKIEHIENDY